MIVIMSAARQQRWTPEGRRVCFALPGVFAPGGAVELPHVIDMNGVGAAAIRPPFSPADVHTRYSMRLCGMRAYWAAQKHILVRQPAACESRCAHTCVGRMAEE